MERFCPLSIIIINSTHFILNITSIGLWSGFYYSIYVFQWMLIERSWILVYFSLYSTNISCLCIKVESMPIKENSFLNLSLLYIEYFILCIYLLYILFLLDLRLVILYNSVIYDNYLLYLLIYHLFTSQKCHLTW